MRWICRESAGLLLLLGLLVVGEVRNLFGDEPIPPDPILEEIIQLRRAIGDTRPPGTKNADVGTNDETFARALRRVAAQNRGESGSQTVSPEPAARVSQPESAQPTAARSVPAQPTGPQSSAPSPKPLDEYVLYDPAVEHQAELVASLRATGRMLDVVAHDHEDKSEYEEADRLHNLARKLLSEARRINRAAGNPPIPAPTAPSAGHANGPALTYPQPSPPVFAH